MTETKQWDLWTEILAARAKAHEKHGANSIEAIRPDDPRWLTILVEEVGEVAHTLTYDADPGQTRAELVDVASVVTAWLDAMDGRARVIADPRAPLGWLDGPGRVPQYESGPVPSVPEGGPVRCPDCEGDGYEVRVAYSDGTPVRTRCLRCDGEGTVES